MKMRIAYMGMAGMLVVVALGCKKGSKDTDQVLANIAGEKITSGQFQESARMIFQDEKRAQDLLKDESAKDQRNQLLESLALQKAMVRFAKAEGLDKDPKAKLMLEQAQARVFFQLLVERRSTKVEPTEEQLRKQWDEIVAQQKAMGRDKGLPPYEQVRENLVARWKQQEQQKQEQLVSESLLKEVKQKYPITFAEGYKPAEPAGQSAPAGQPAGMPAGHPPTGK